MVVFYGCLLEYILQYSNTARPRQYHTVLYLYIEEAGLEDDTKDIIGPKQGLQIL
jgi:hypothetical protein